MSEEFKPQAVGFWRRLGAFVVDTLVLAVPLFVIGQADFDAAASLGPWGRIIGMAVGVAYFGVLNSRIGGGRTLGKRWLGIHVVGQDGRPPSLARSLGRAAVLVLPMMFNGLLFKSTGDLAGWIFGIVAVVLVVGVLPAQVYLLIFQRPQRRLVHDLLLGTQVRRAEDASAPEPVSRRQITIAAVIGVGLLATALALLWVFVPRAPKLYQQLGSVQARVEGLPEVMSAGVQDFHSVFITNGSRSDTHALAVTVEVSHWPSDMDQERTRLARVVLGAYRFEPGQQLTIQIRQGFDLGWASSSRSDARTESPSEWSAPQTAPTPGTRT